ncbi:hypothetical protein BJX70DRAFT_374397 [Aspergillus crustosus]
MDPRFFDGSEAGDWTSLGIDPDLIFDSDTTLRKDFMGSELYTEALQSVPGDVGVFQRQAASEPQQQFVNHYDPAIAQNTDAEQVIYHNNFYPQPSL